MCVCVCVCVCARTRVGVCVRYPKKVGWECFCLTIYEESYKSPGVFNI